MIRGPVIRGGPFDEWAVSRSERFFKSLRGFKERAVLGSGRR